MIAMTSCTKDDLPLRSKVKIFSIFVLSNSSPVFLRNPIPFPIKITSFPFESNVLTTLLLITFCMITFSPPRYFQESLLECMLLRKFHHLCILLSKAVHDFGSAGSFLLLDSHTAFLNIISVFAVFSQSALTTDRFLRHFSRKSLPPLLHLDLLRFHHHLTDRSYWML